MDVKVSIVIPCYNCAVVVKRAIDSVINQSYKYWELILVDNNSSDNTWNVIKSYQDLYPDTISIYEESSPGAPSARNTGLEAAKGEWILFLDSDDELLHDHLQNQILFINHNDCDVVVNSFYRVISVKGIRLMFPKFPSYDSWLGLINGYLGITSSNLFKKSCLIHSGGWNVAWTSSQEYELMFRIMKLGYNVVPRRRLPSVKVYFSKGSISRSNDRARAQQIFNNFVELRRNIRGYLIRENRFTSKYSSALSTTLYSYYLTKNKTVAVSSDFLISNQIEINIFDRTRIQLRSWLTSILN